jgi:hypothetical protein
MDELIYFNLLTLLQYDFNLDISRVVIWGFNDRMLIFEERNLEKHGVYIDATKLLDLRKSANIGRTWCMGHVSILFTYYEHIRINNRGATADTKLQKLLPSTLGSLF